MLKLKKGARLSSFLFFLMLLSFGGVSYVVFKDFFLAPAELFEKAQLADYNKEFKKAEKYYLLAVRSDDVSISTLSAYYLGVLYKKSEAKVLQNYQKSKTFFEKAALKKLPQAQYELALLYDTGDKIKENRIEAVKWMQKAAEQGFVEAEYAYGVYIDRGYVEGLSSIHALPYYEKAAMKGHVPAIKGLALIYKLGAEGIPPDEEKYHFWMNKVLK